MQPQVPVLMPVAADLLKAFKPIALRVRKTGNECRALAPIVDYVRREHDYKAGRKAREKARPKHTVLRQNHGRCCIAAYRDADYNYGGVSRV